MDKLNEISVFSVKGKKYAIFSVNIEKVYEGVEITHLPKAPPIIQGVFNVKGHIIPVINMSVRFSSTLEEDPAAAKIIIMNFHDKRFALAVDDFSGPFNDLDIMDPENLSYNSDFAEGIIKYGDEIVTICKPEKLYQPEEESYINHTLDYFGDSIKNISSEIES